VLVLPLVIDVVVSATLLDYEHEHDYDWILKAVATQMT
jgi:hypothetical protein